MLTKKFLAKHLRHPKGLIGRIIGNYMNRRNALMYKLTIDWMKIKDEDKILEIGIGNGKFIKDMIKKANSGFMAGIDISGTMIKQAQKINKNLINQSKVTIKKSDIQKIPFKNESFDKICTLNTIYFWKNPKKCFQEIYRVLKSKGYLFISLHTKERIKILGFEKHNFTLYDYDDINKLLERAKFKNIHYKYEPYIDSKRDLLCVIARK